MQAVILLFIFIFFLIVVRLFFIQVTRASFLKELAKRQQSFFIKLTPKRGSIYDCQLRPLALNIPRKSLYAVSRQIKPKDKEKIVEFLSESLNLDKNFLIERLSRDKSFVWIKRLLDDSDYKDVEQRGLEGLGFIGESKRVYTNGNLASHIIGFAGIDNVGLEGIELYYDDYLKGQGGSEIILKDAHQKPILQELNIPAKDGFDLVLTIDEIIQFITEKHLKTAFEKYKAKAASAIVLEPATGRVLALANFPNYDLNKPELDNNARRNRAICDIFEPGSVFKIVLAACALEETDIDEKDKIFCENGAFKVANHILHDHRPHGWLTFKDVIVQSSNIGVVKIAQGIDPQVLYKYIKLFGFGSPTGVDFPGEVSGIVKEPSSWSKTSISAIPIGQEVGVTVLQLAASISAIANNGILMKPYLIERIQDKSGVIIKEFIPTIRRRIISEDTAMRLKEILVSVVEEGTGRLAKVPNMSVAGKSGTAQKIEEDGSYSHSEFFASFIGFAPADFPRIAVVVVVDEPRPVYFGGVVSAPVFKNIAVEVLKYLRGRGVLRLRSGW